MGYLLPITPIQSQQYANRISMEPYNFATVGRLQPIKLKSDFLDEFEDVLHSQEDKEQEEREQSETVPSPQSYKGFVPPNPANLSPAISQAIGKGISVNTYI